MNLKKHLTLSNVLFAGLLVAMVIPSSRVFIQSHLLRVFLGSPHEEKNLTVLDQSDLAMRLESSDGTIVRLGDLAGQPMVINAWATWCGPCVAEMPSIQKLYEVYGDEVRFVLVSNEPWEKITSFIADKGYDLPVYRPLNAWPEKLRADLIPATFIIGSNHKILVAEEGAKNWNSGSVHEILDNQLKNNTSLNHK